MPPSALQMRPQDGSDERLYNPGRDIAHNFKHICLETALRAEQQRWEELEIVLLNAGVTPEEMGAGLQALARFVIGASDSPKESMLDVLKRVGWLKLPPLVQIAVMAYLGQVIAGMYYTGARDATINGVGPCLNNGELTEQVKRSAKVLQTRVWRRRWYWLISPCINLFARGPKPVKGEPHGEA